MIFGLARTRIISLAAHPYRSQPYFCACRWRGGKELVISSRTSRLFMFQRSLCRFGIDLVADLLCHCACFRFFHFFFLSLSSSTKMRQMALGFLLMSKMLVMRRPSLFCYFFAILQMLSDDFLLYGLSFA